MWIEEKTLKNGTIKYKYCEQQKSPYTSNMIRVSVTMANNSTQSAKTATRLLLTKLDEAIEKDKVKATKASTVYFHDVGKEWQAYKALGVKASTVENDRITLSKLFGLIPPNTPIDSVKAVEVEKFVRTMYYQENYSYTYTKKVLTTFKQVMRYAKKKKVIKDISEYEEITLTRKPISLDELKEKHNKFLENDELEAVYKGLAQYPRIALLCEFLVHTGLRGGELLALRECDYNKQEKYIYVNGTISHQHKNNDKEKRGTPKNVYSVRYVGLDDRSIEILDTFIKENRFLSWNSSYKNDDKYIFVSLFGSPYDMHYINSRLRKLDINGKRITTHIFRHTHISILASLAIPLKAIMNRVGHNDPKTTLSIYSHVSKDMEKDIIEKLNQAI